MRVLSTFATALLAAQHIAGLPTAKPPEEHQRRTITVGLTKQHEMRSRAVSNGLEKRASTAELETYRNVRYFANVTLASQTFGLLLDSGSSDTFVLGVLPTSLTNLNETGPKQDLVFPLFDNATASEVQYLNLTWNQTFGVGVNTLNTLGAIGTTEMTIGDVSHAAFPFANIWQSSQSLGAPGLLGLGFPITSKIMSTVLLNANATGSPFTAEEASAYWPIVPLLARNGTIDKAMYSLVVEHAPWDQVAADTIPALDQGANATYRDLVYEGGSLTLGGVPDGYSEDDFTFVEVPRPVTGLPEYLPQLGYPTPNSANLWSAPIDGIYFNGQLLRNTTEQPSLAEDRGKFYALIDSGNHGINIPGDIMSQITPAWAANPEGATVPCNTRMELVFVINGRNLTIKSDGLLIPSSITPHYDTISAQGPARNDCQFIGQIHAPDPGVSGPGTSRTYSLGDAFMKDLAIVFDYGDLLNVTAKPPRLGFAQRGGNATSSDGTTGGSGNSTSGNGNGGGGGSTGAAARLSAAGWTTVAAALFAAGALL